MISIVLVFMALLYIVLGVSENFYAILILTFFISLGVAILNTLTSALVVSYTHPKDK